MISLDIGFFLLACIILSTTAAAPAHVPGRLSGRSFSLLFVPRRQAVYVRIGAHWFEAGSNCTTALLPRRSAVRSELDWDLKARTSGRPYSLSAPLFQMSVRFTAGKFLSDFLYPLKWDLSTEFRFFRANPHVDWL
jgi:hypothetical protein